MCVALKYLQVYDWRQYQSEVDGQDDGSPLNKEVTPHHSLIVGTMDSDEDTSLSAVSCCCSSYPFTNSLPQTMTGWNNRLLETPVHTSLDE